MDPDVYSFMVVVAVITAFIGSMVALFIGARVALQRTRPREIAPVDDARFERLEQAVDTIAIEIERMSESQRFTAKLLSERAPAALPVRADKP
ncbi:MAG: hypothetical protein ACJ79K_08870 [Gemmatimonadaceae bacterium]